MLGPSSRQFTDLHEKCSEWFECTQEIHINVSNENESFSVKQRSSIHDLNLKNHKRFLKWKNAKDARELKVPETIVQYGEQTPVYVDDVDIKHNLGDQGPDIDIVLRPTANLEFGHNYKIDSEFQEPSKEIRW